MKGRKANKLLSLALAAVITLALPPTAVAAKDFTLHWSAPAYKLCDAFSVVNSAVYGYDPDEIITLAEFCSMINNTFNFTETEGAVGSPGADYGGEFGNDMKIASAMGYLSEYNETAGWNDFLTREQAFCILARICELDNTNNSETRFTDDAEISDWARGLMNSMINARNVRGMGDNTVSSQTTLTKGQAAQVLYNMFGRVVDWSLTTDTVYKNLTVRRSSATVKSTVITGDLYVTDGVGNGSAEFAYVTVNGRALITGGGNSISFRNSKLNDLVISGKRNTHVKLTNTALDSLTFTASGQVSLPNAIITFNEASGSLTMIGTYGNIVENSDKTVTVTVNDMTFTIRFGAHTYFRSLVHLPRP